MKRIAIAVALLIGVMLSGCSSSTSSDSTVLAEGTDSIVAQLEVSANSTDSQAAVAAPLSKVESKTSPTVKISVVTTTPVITDFVTNLGGDRVTIYPVLKADVDPHDYEATPADLEAMASADVLVKNGVGLEKWFDSTVKNSETKGVIVDASTGVALRKGDEPEDESLGDPHIWQDPRNAKIMVKNITAALVQVDPGAKSVYEANLVDYLRQLDELDADVAKQIAALTNKKIVTNHDAFGYYIDRYQLTFVGAIIPSFDSQAELSPADVNTLVAKIKSEGVRAIFSESSLPAKTAVALAVEASVRVVAGEGSLFGDSLGAPGGSGDTYITMIQHNTKAIVDNLKE